jgi:hypothetical protein
MKLKIVTIDIPMPTWARRATQVVIVALGLGASAIALGVPNEFASGAPVTAKGINDNFKDLEARVAKLEARSGGTASAYCGSTAPTKGDMSGLGSVKGYPGAREGCVKACNGSATAHVCTGPETAFAASIGKPMPAGWTQNGIGGVTGYTTNLASNDCEGWQSAGSFATYWNGPGEPIPAGNSCSNERPMICCN